jgi:(p)ppGpp synthase/HD superfamily hydrolase
MYFDDIRQEFFGAVDKLEPAARQTLHAAYELAEKEHQGQLRKQHKSRPAERDPYLIHPLRVSLVLIKELNLCDVTALASAVLHDVVEDGNSSPTVDDLSAAFGADIAETVRYLTKPRAESSADKPTALRPYHESFFRAPLVVRLVKLADRLDNMREAVLVDQPSFQTRYLRETREIYIPLARQTSLFYAAQLKTLCDKLECCLPA